MSPGGVSFESSSTVITDIPFYQAGNLRKRCQAPLTWAGLEAILCRSNYSSYADVSSRYIDILDTCPDINIMYYFRTAATTPPPHAAPEPLIYPRELLISREYTAALSQQNTPFSPEGSGGGTKKADVHRGPTS